MTAGLHLSDRFQNTWKISADFHEMSRKCRSWMKEQIVRFGDVLDSRLTLTFDPPKIATMDIIKQPAM